MPGFLNRILHVDLSRGRHWVEEPGQAFYRRYLGGRAVVAHYLLQLVPAKADPLGPENVLVMAPGVVTGAIASGQGRNGVGAKSPLTGGLASAEAGGFFGAELKRAGFDGLVLRGKADRPVYLWIHDGEVELRDAAHLWGLPVGDAEDRIREEVGAARARTCLIGPAGENLVRYACIVNDRSHFAGRGGLGAVMGSKQLKGIAVVAPPGKASPLQIADTAAVSAINRWTVDNFELVKGYHELGTAGGVNGLAGLGGLPVRYFSAGSWDKGPEYDGQRMVDTILVKRETCASCAVRCKRVVAMDEPHKVDPRYGGPEYESLSAFGNNCGISDLSALAKANELCAAYGLDTISTGMVIAFAMEMVEQRRINAAQFEGGPELRYGNAAAMLACVEAIARRQGIGDLLAEGTSRVARRLGPEAEAMALTVKGQEFPLHEPRIKHALGLGYAVSPTGADHMHNMHDTSYGARTRWWNDLQTYKATGLLDAHGFDEEKLEAFYYQLHFRHALDSMVMCDFLAYPPPQQAALVRACTGWEDFDHWELLQVGLRAHTLGRLFNQRCGLTAADDRLPARMFEPLAQSRTGRALDPDAFAAARRWLYQRMGWDPETGAPLQETLAELDLLETVAPAQ